MKTKVTAKAIKENCKTVIPVGYCEMYNLLRSKTPAYYTAGVYGWNSDIYVITNSLVISTGYRPVGTIKLTLEQYQLIKDYEAKARSSNEDIGMRYEQCIIEVDLILRQLIKELNIVEKAAGLLMDR